MNLGPERGTLRVRMCMRPHGWNRPRLVTLRVRVQPRPRLVSLAVLVGPRPSLLPLVVGMRRLVRRLRSLLMRVRPRPSVRPSELGIQPLKMGLRIWEVGLRSTVNRPLVVRPDGRTSWTRRRQVSRPAWMEAKSWVEQRALHLLRVRPWGCAIAMWRSGGCHRTAVDDVGMLDSRAGLSVARNPRRSTHVKRRRLRVWSRGGGSGTDRAGGRRRVDARFVVTHPIRDHYRRR
jgi:hypothetical protein